jgi:hypothetical protein
MDGGRDCAARIDLHLPKLRLSPGFQLSITFRSRMWQGVRMLSRFRSPMMKFEYQVKPFSAGQPPDQIEKVSSIRRIRMGSRGNLRKARFYSVLCAEENHRAETGGGVAAAVGCSGGDGISRHEKKLGLLIAGRPSAFCNSRASG